jgi:hypothetical protein
MARESTIKLEFELEQPGTGAITLKTPGITKSTAAGTAGAPATTVITYDDTAAPNPMPKAGDKMLISGTGWPSLDGKLVKVTAVDNTTAHTITVEADTFAETATLPTTLTDIKASVPTWAHVCLSEFSPNAGAPGEVDATTMCDTERVTLPGLPTPGTASFTGMFDLDDKGMLALQAAYDDGKPRHLIAKTRRGQQATFHGVVSSFAMGALAVEGAVTFTGNFTLDRAPTYAKAA